MMTDLLLILAGYWMLVTLGSAAGLAAIFLWNELCERRERRANDGTQAPAQTAANDNAPAGKCAGAAASDRWVRWPDGSWVRVIGPSE